MPSNHDPILSLEPSNLLEPLGLEDRDLDPFNREARFGHDGTWPQGTARTRSRPPSVPRRGGRWPLKSALIVAGGLACFGAGTAMPGLSLLGDAQRPPAVQSAAQQPPVASIKAEAAKPAEAKPTEQTPPAPSEAAALDPNANGASTNGARNAAPSPAPAANQTAVDRAAPVAADVLAGGVAPGANAPRDAPANAVPGDARPSHDANRGSSRRRDRATTDNARAPNDWGLWRDQETDRPSSRRRDRYDDEARADDRRGSRRASRYGGRSLFPFFDEW